MTQSILRFFWITQSSGTDCIVGELEADIDQGMISHSSPIARALIGRTSGDEVEFTAPDGTRRYEILAVRCTNVETASND